LTDFKTFNKFTVILKSFKKEKVEGPKLLFNILNGVFSETSMTKFYIDDEMTVFINLNKLNLNY
jgi:hypothetical protein